MFNLISVVNFIAQKIVWDVLKY